MSPRNGNSSQVDAPSSGANTSRSSGYIAALLQVLQQLPAGQIDAITAYLIETYERGGAVYLFGNGGSAALASHAACDLGKGTAARGKRRFRVVSLTDNVPLITAWANDARYEDVFAEQLRNFVRPGDVSLAISGSGNSPNVLNALRLCTQLGGFNIGLTGFEGGKMKQLCDLCLVVPSNNMQHIEDSHVVISHVIFTAVRDYMTAPAARAAAANAVWPASGIGRV